ncbi:MAG: hypothetical protein LBC60_05680 [Spirochaetaceae bacterium]|jgi:hypothetical protein|nr:hypothetical protein [Spirochaetaceae bacterium]
MGNILEKARMILRNVYVALGATAMPVLIHAAYGMREPDPESYTVPVQGRVVSEETGEPVAGIRVQYDNYAIVDTDGDGRFLVYVPEENFYSIGFVDIDGFENSGFFSYKNMSIPRDKIENPLAVSLHRESQVAVIRGTVRSKGIIGKPVSGIRVSVSSMDGNSGESGNIPFYSGFEVLSDNDGKFSIQVPKRDVYSIQFFDENGLFQGISMYVTSDEIKRSLKVRLEKNR